MRWGLTQQRKGMAAEKSGQNVIMNSEIRSCFPVTKEYTYLDTAYIGPYPTPVVRAGQEFLERRSTGAAGRADDWLSALDDLRGAVAQLIGATAGEIALTSNTTYGTNLVAAVMNLGPSDNVVWDDLDFSSNKMVWLHQQQARGVENRVVGSKDGAVNLADYERLVDHSTRVISVSYVSYINGYRHDLAALADLAHSYGAYLHVDAIQALGALRINVKESNIDFLSCGTYKWLLGPQGLGFFYIREDLVPRFAPTAHGWMQVKSWPDTPHPSMPELHQSARKFESATLNLQGVHELRASLNFTDGIGRERIEEWVLRLSSRLWQGLAQLGLRLLTPPQTRSGIVTCWVEDVGKVSRLLDEKRIVTTVRDNGQIRVSPHFYNTEEEIDRLVSTLASVV
jgi:selenocysteine lyase/cysteine desulfurase